MITDSLFSTLRVITQTNCAKGDENQLDANFAPHNDSFASFSS
jgi:hypothetical protein